MVNNLDSLINRKRNGGVLFAILQIIILIFLVINAYLHQYSIADSIKLFVYQFFAWFLVGCAIANILINQIKSLTELVALSYAIGGVASLLTYFVCMLLQKPQFIVWVVIIESLMSALLSPGACGAALQGDRMSAYFHTGVFKRERGFGRLSMPPEKEHCPKLPGSSDRAASCELSLDRAQKKLQ